MMLVSRRLGRALLVLGALIMLAMALGNQGAALAQTPDEEVVTIDPAGIIRARDPSPPSGRLAVTWFSPTGGYVNAALVDANRDGDMEIVAMRNVTVDGVPAYRLDLYDPVVASGPVDPDQTIGAIPWALLYSLPLTDQPALVAAGDLDPAAPGDEIFVTERFQVGENRFSQHIFYLRNSGALDGRAWTPIELPIGRQDWSSVAIGNMDAEGTDEVALVAGTTGTLEVWRVLGGTASRIYENESDNWRWNHVAFGPWRGDGRDLLAAVRRGAARVNTLVILRVSFTTGDVVDDFSESFAPGPEHVFFGDINGSGDAEVFMLRSVPSNEPNRARLIGRNRGSDTLPPFEEPLNADNGFRVGAAGDIDGDGRDELVIVRSDRLRLYATPEANATFSEVSLATDARNILIGDLDRNGYLLPLRLVASPTSLGANAASGEEPQEATLALSANPGNAVTPYRVAVRATSGADAGRQPTWLSVAPDGGATPRTLTVTFDASRLSPGTYSADILVSSANSLVFDQPLTIPATFNVAPGLLARPGALSFRQVGCPAAGGAPDLRSATVRIEAPAGTSYLASLLALPTDAAAATSAAAAAPDLINWPSSVPWASASSPTGVAVEELTVTVDLAQRTSDWISQASLVLVANVSGVQMVRSVPIAIICSAQEDFLPIVGK